MSLTKTNLYYIISNSTTSFGDKIYRKKTGEWRPSTKTETCLCLQHVNVLLHSCQLCSVAISFLRHSASCCRLVCAIVLQSRYWAVKRFSLPHRSAMWSVASSKSRSLCENTMISVHTSRYYYTCNCSKASTRDYINVLKNTVHIFINFGL